MEPEDGLHLALNIAGMLIGFLALIAMLNGILDYFFHVSLQFLLGKLFAPIAWLLGVSYNDCATIGSLLGTRLVLNEFIAFQQLGPLRDHLDPRSFVIATYALCGFANLSSIAIQIGGIGALAPNRKSDLARLGLRAVMAGTMANFMTACIAGMPYFRMQQAIAFIRTLTPAAPRIGVVLGSGLGAFAAELEDAVEIPYANISGWPPSTAIGHAGKLVLGKLDGREIAVMSGRSHLYEGYSAFQVTYGVRVLFGLGVRSMVFTNASGGINLDYGKEVWC